MELVYAEACSRVCAPTSSPIPHTKLPLLFAIFMLFFSIGSTRRPLMRKPDCAQYLVIFSTTLSGVRSRSLLSKST